MRDNRRCLEGGMYICSGCGKKTRETGKDESSCTLCKKCYIEALEENRRLNP